MPTLRAAVAAAAFWAVAAAAGAASGPEGGQEKPKPKAKAENPFVADKLNRSIAVHELSVQETVKFAQSAKKPYGVVLMVNFEPDLQESKCRSPQYCRWFDKQFTALAEGYTEQLRNGQVYEPQGERLFFARVYAPDRDKLAKALKLQRLQVPSVLLLKPRSKDAALFGSKELRLQLPDTRDAKALVERREAAKRPSLKRALRRAERRRRQVGTQEEKEERAQGLSGYHNPQMRNLCKWLKIETGQMMAHCPQDVDRSIVSKESKSQAGKKVLVAVIGLSSFLYLARVFGIVLSPIQPSHEDLRRAQIVAAGVREHGEKHVAYQAVGAWWRFYTTVAALLCIVFVGCCASGMYWNFLNNRPILGDTIKAPLGKLTGYTRDLPQPFTFSTTLAATVAVSALSLIALGRAATVNHILVKTPLVFVCLAVWMSTGLAVLNWFSERNYSYLRGTPMTPYIEMVKKLA